MENIYAEIVHYPVIVAMSELGLDKEILESEWMLAKIKPVIALGESMVEQGKQRRLPERKKKADT